MKEAEQSGMMRIAAVLFLAVGALAAPARALDIEVQVSTVDGKKFTGTLYAGEQALPVESGKAKVAVKGLEDRKRVAVAADLSVAQGSGKPPLRYVGVAEVVARKGALTEVKAGPVRDMNAFCSGCHPSEKDPVKEGQVVRDLHASGQELTGRYLAQVGKFKDYIEKKRKEGKERPPEPVVLEERIVIVNGKEVKKYFYTCESCHTVHWKTPWTKYARAPFTEKGTLCAGCHY